MTLLMSAGEKKHLVHMSFSSAPYQIDDAVIKSLYVNKQKNVMQNRFNGLQPFVSYCTIVFVLPSACKMQTSEQKAKAKTDEEEDRESN